MYSVGSLFAGVGGICLGFKSEGCNIVWANEFDKNACITYRYNFGSDYLYEGDVRTVNFSEIPYFDILTAGFPCQAFSIAGEQKGFDDERGNLFFDIVRLIKEKEKIFQKPKVIFLENVKNLISHDNKRTFKIIYDKLTELGYNIKYKILNSSEYGNIPQNRERIYIVGFLNKNHCDNFEFPNKIKLTKKISDIVLLDEKKDEIYYYNNSKYSDMLKNFIKSNQTLYQIRRIYVRENKNNLCPTLTANMGTGGHNVPIVLDNFGIRKLTPKETFLFQGFPEDYKLPNLANSHLYKQAGNSVVVTVIKRISKNIISALNSDAVNINKHTIK